MQTVSVGPLLVVALLAGTAAAAEPNHPVITEVYFDPIGLNDGPVGRDGASVHQEYIEIYLPPAAALSPALDKDALRLALIEVEGDTTSTGLGLVNYRFDLPTLDLDPANGLTAGALPRPTGGVVVVGWLDYAGNPPTDLAGTPATRVALINGGVTAAPPGSLFIAINGLHFSGTTNFAPVLAESMIALPAEAMSGVIQNGSGAVLLLNRDSAGYVQLCDDADAASCAAGANPGLADGAILGTGALLDAVAGNDHPCFLVEDQPYDAPTGDEIDLETVLPLGGAFSLLVPQVPEDDTTQPAPGIADGYARVFVDVPKTTETAEADDPVADATLAYRHIRNAGPFAPTPGRAAHTLSAPELGAATGGENLFEVLAGTTGRPGLLCANIGGNFGIDVAASPGASSNPAVATFAAGSAAPAVGGQQFGFPSVAVTVPLGAAEGSSASASVQVTATNSSAGDPAVVGSPRTTTVTATVLSPATGQDVNGAPLQATVFVAVQGIPISGAVANELAGTSLGQHLAATLGNASQDTLGNTAALIDPVTNLNDGLVMDSFIADMPSDPLQFINPPGAPGTHDLVQTVLQSAEVQSGAGSYDDAFNVTQTAISAISLNIPDTLTRGGAFTPTERVHFADARGTVGVLRSGLTDATTTRTFEVAIIDTAVRLNSTIETGATDDFGIVLEVEATELGAPVVDGEYVFLSMTGGLQGADIDSLDVPPGNNIATVIYLDLDNLHDVLGIISIERVLLIDGSGNGTVDVVELLSLNPVSVVGCTPAQCDDGLFCTGTEGCVADACASSGDPCAALGLACDEAIDQCVCVVDGDCDDGQFCTGVETCVGSTCQSSGDPCAASGMVCDELTDVCFCSSNAQCEDGLYCSGVETCVNDMCQSSGDPCTSMGLACDESTDTCIPVGGCPGGTAAECCDLDANQVRDDNCQWCACQATVCSAMAIPHADMGGAFGACVPDGFCNVHDRNQALTCFSGTNSCDPLNLDAGGAFGACAADGFCNIHDANHALTCFGGTNTCSCGPSPSGPIPGPVAVDRTGIVMRPQRQRVAPGETVGVEVWTTGPLAQLQGYQLEAWITGGRRGALVVVDVVIEPRVERAFFGLPAFTAFNIERGQLLAGLDGKGIAAPKAVYLGTFRVRAEPGSEGAFVLDLARDDSGNQSVFLAAPTAPIAITTVGPATIHIVDHTAVRRRLERRGR